MSSAARAGDPAPSARRDASSRLRDRSVVPAAPPLPSAASAALAGIVAAAAGIGVSELVAGLVPGAPSLVVAVGSLLIALQPPGAKDLVVALFGTGDKTALGVAVAVVALAAGAIAGLIGRRNLRSASTLLVVVGTIAGAAALLQPLYSPLLGVLNAALGVVVAAAALRFLLALAAIPQATGACSATGAGTAVGGGSAAGGASAVGAGSAAGGASATGAGTAVGGGSAAGAGSAAGGASATGAGTAVGGGSAAGGTRRDEAPRREMAAPPLSGASRPPLAGIDGAPLPATDASPGPARDAAPGGVTGALPRFARDAAPGGVTGAAQDAAPRSPVDSSSEPIGGMPTWGRRRFLLSAGSLLGGALLAGGLGRLLLQRRFPAAAPISASLPVPTDVVPPLAPAQSLAAAGITPIVVPNDRFYRIDTELLVPQVDATTWQLKVTGMVDHPLTLSYDELLALPLFEQYVTIACVSNPVGGDLVGNTLWTGVHLRQVLAAAGIRAGATQIVGRAVDGFTVGFPTEWALDPSREPMIAVGMNRVPLPAEHGYPARLIVPGLYGYVSATKWLSEIQLTTMEAFDAYWVRLGWAKEGPIVTESRIDHPADGASLAAGPVTIDGLAWAPDRGISRVEVRVDGGAWEPARLSRAISKATWVQWLYRWTAPAGTHVIEVRATDGTGAVQTATPSAPFPSGARGYDRVQVTVA